MDSTSQERRAWLKDWVSGNPRATIEQAKSALKQEFGIGLGTELVATILRETQEELLRRAGALPSEPATLSPSIRDLVTQMKAAGIRRIEILEDGVDVLFLA